MAAFKETEQKQKKGEYLQKHQDSFLELGQLVPAVDWNQRWNNVVYVNVEVYNIEQCWNNIVLFNVELNNVVRQRRHNVGNMTIWRKKKYIYIYISIYIYKPRFKNKIIFLNFKKYVELNIFLPFFPILREIYRASKNLKTSNILN